MSLPRPGPENVYNLEVNTEHVYFVGDSGLLVHNFGCEDVAQLQNMAEMIRREHASDLVVARKYQTVSIIQLEDGTRIVAGGAQRNLDDAQKALARKWGLVVADDNKKLHAELTAIRHEAMNGGNSRPIGGVATRGMCSPTGVHGGKIMGEESCQSQLAQILNLTMELSEDETSFIFNWNH